MAGTERTQKHWFADTAILVMLLIAGRGWVESQLEFPSENLPPEALYGIYATNQKNLALPQHRRTEAEKQERGKTFAFSLRSDKG